MSTEIVPTTHELSGCTALRVRNHRGDVTVTHTTTAGDADAFGHGAGTARVRLTPKADVDLGAATVRLEDGTLVVDVPHLDRTDGGGTGNELATIDGL